MRKVTITLVDNEDGSIEFTPDISPELLTLAKEDKGGDSPSLVALFFITKLLEGELDTAPELLGEGDFDESDNTEASV